jgi:hypothetical protein
MTTKEKNIRYNFFFSLWYSFSAQTNPQVCARKLRHDTMKPDALAHMIRTGIISEPPELILNRFGEMRVQDDRVCSSFRGELGIKV